MKSDAMSSLSSRSKLALIAYSENSSKSMKPLPFLSIKLNIAFGSGNLTPQRSIMGIAFKNSEISILLLPDLSIWENITQYSKYYLKYNKKYLNSDFSM